MSDPESRDVVEQMRSLRFVHVPGASDLMENACVEIEKLRNSIPMRSVRFFPNWNRDSGDQVVGFLNLVNHILRANPNTKTWLEIGSLYGESATLLLGFPQIVHIALVDSSKEICNRLDAKFAREIAAHRLTLINATSQEFAKSAPSCFSVDVVYIDADHTYEAVKADLHSFARMVAPGGFICGHDYHPKWPGVVQAVDEFASARGMGGPQQFCDGSWLIELI